MKRTAEFTLLIIGLIWSIVFTIFVFIVKASLGTPEVKTELTKAIEQQNRENPDVAIDQNADQLIDMLHPMANGAIVILVISILFAISALIFVKRQRILAGVLAVIAGLVSIVTMNILSVLLFIIAGIVLFVRKDQSKHQFEDVNFQDKNHRTDDEIYHQKDDFNNRDKKKKDDDPYIY